MQRVMPAVADNRVAYRCKIVSEPRPQKDELHQKHTTKNLSGVLPFTRLRWKKVGLFILSLVLFFIALETMKAGARGMKVLTRNITHINGPLKGLGLGWISSYLTLSGSPIAAVALTLFDVNTINNSTAFSMVVGSRLGGSLIVIMIGLFYILRGHARGTSLLTGILTFIVTGLIYIPAAPLGLLFLDVIQFNIPLKTSLSGFQGSFLDQLTGPVFELINRALPRWSVFGLGVLLTVGSLNLIDKSLPDLDLEDNIFGDVSSLLYRPSISFLLGFLFTLLTMSVSISLGLLVPLSVRGYIRRENLVPYIMGCNISTFIDTVIASLLLRNPQATNLVLVQTLSVLIISLLILIFFFRRFQTLTLQAALWLNKNRFYTAAFLFILLLLPLLFVLL